MTFFCTSNLRRLIPFHFLLLAVAFYSMLRPVSALALPETDTTAFTMDNDFFVGNGTDSYYSGGLRLSFQTDYFDEFTDDNSPRWMRRLFGAMPLVSGEGFKRSSSYGFGQVVNTPLDITVPAPQPDDLPYSGLLYGYYSLQGHTERHAESISALVGVVGPLSLAEQTQKLIHKLTGSDPPQGWDFQLKDEPVVNLAYNYSHMFYNTRWQNQWGMQLVGSASVYMGNLITGASLNIAAFLGQQGSYNPLNFHSDMLVRSNFHSHDNQRAGFYLFGGTGVDLYMHNIFLDGNTFHDGPSVEKEPQVYNRFVGVGYNWLEYSVHFTWFDQNKLFVGQKYNIEYGSLNFSWRH